MKKNFTTFMALMASLLISAHCFAQDSLVPFDAHSSIWGGMFAPQSPEGLDWALNAGGTLIREIRGFATDHLGSVRALGRTSQDPLATKYPGISPYSYCAGDPVGYVDVKGCSMTDYYTMTGRYYGTIPDGSSDRYIINQRILKKNDVSENVGSAYLNGNLLPVVSSASIQAMDKTYQMTESDNKEHGFVSAMKAQFLR